MLVAIDIGNSSTKFGVFRDENNFEGFQIPTIRTASAADLSVAIGSRITCVPEKVFVSSVVPETRTAFDEYFLTRFGTRPFFLDSSFPFGLKIRYEPASGLGVDRLVAAFSASRIYDGDLIVCDFGTATTIDAVSAGHEFLGGIITPGMSTLAESLKLKTSKLPLVEIEKPESVLGRSTADSIKSGVFYGYIGLVEGLIKRISDEFDTRPKVVATGGFAKMIAAETKSVDHVEPDLMLRGIGLCAGLIEKV